MSGRGPSSGDVVAGVSVALVAIPQSLAYAELAGLPAQHGLFASALPSIAAAAFVSSRHLQTGPVALTSLLTFGALSGMAPTGTAEFARLAAVLALLVGLFRLGLGLIRLGRLAYLLSEPVLTGFTTAAAVLILSSQLPRVFDAEPGDGGVLVEAFQALVDVDRWRLAAIGFSLATAAVILAGRRVHRLFPGVLVAVVAATGAVGVFGYDGTTTGDLEGGFVSLSLDLPWGETGGLLLPAFVIALVGFAEPASIARTFAAQDRVRWDSNREMISQGVANVVAGLTRAFPVGGSFSRSSLNRLAGATSPWAGAITGVCVLLALPATPLLADLPRAVLATIVVVAVVGLLRFDQLVGLVRVNLAQGLVGVGTFAATLAASPRVERGVLIGIGLALAVHLYRELRVTADSEWSDEELVVRPHGVLWFATVPSVDSLIREHLARHPDTARVVFDLESVGRLDYSAGAALSRLVEELGDAGVEVRLIHVYSTTARAVAAHLSDLNQD
ncbi:MAG: SulP family inorganic anion transporter [Actinomycetota bacterium]